MKKKTKIIISIVASAVVFVMMVFIALKVNFSQMETLGKYAIFQVTNTEPLIFSGVVEAENIETVYLDTARGEISEIRVEDGQNVEERDILFVYENGTRVRANSDGIIILREDGKTNPSVPFIQIVSESVVAIGQVSEHDFNALSVNQEVMVRPVSTNDEIQGYITSIDMLPSSELGSSAAVTYHFTVDLKEFVQYGFNVQIFLSEERLVIPESAIIQGDEEEFVFVYVEGRATKTEIITAEENNLIVVLEGLEHGDRIIENPDDELQNGQEVMLKQ